MMKIMINGNEIELTKDSSLIDALATSGFNSDKTGFAIAINGEFIPRSLYPTTFLNPDDVIEVLTAMQGG